VGDAKINAASAACLTSSKPPLPLLWCQEGRSIHLQHHRIRGESDRSIQLEAHSSVKKDSLALDIRTPAQEKIAQFGGVVITTECGIETEKYFAVRG